MSQKQLQYATYYEGKKARETEVILIRVATFTYSKDSEGGN